MASHICMYVVECICLVSANVHLMTVMIKKREKEKWSVLACCF